MRSIRFFGLLLSAELARGAILPVITLQPTNQNVSPGGTATFSVTATNATSFQWRYNGSDIPNATNATLQVTGAQTNNTGYYNVIAKNDTGWVPSGLAYLSTGLSIFDDNAGAVPFSNTNSAQADYEFGFSSGPISAPNAMATVVAGPQLDEMQAIDFYSASVSNGYFDGIAALVPTVMPGQTVYYRVAISYTLGGYAYTQFSTTLKLTATKYPDLPDASNLKFPTWPEWPEPALLSATPTNQIRIPGETVDITNSYFAYTDFGQPTCQWRKDGEAIPGATNFVLTSGGSFGGNYQAVLTVTNLQREDAGVYDVAIFGNNWLIGPKTTLSVQTANESAVFNSPRTDGSNFVVDLEGIVGRNYAIQWSSNLLDWNTLTTISNATGTLTFTNTPNAEVAEFYRALLLP